MIIYYSTEFIVMNFRLSYDQQLAIHLIEY